MFLVVENRHEDVEVREQVRNSDGRGEFDREVRRFAPLRELLIERVAGRAHGVPERLEELSQETFPTATAGQGGDARDQRQWRLREFRLVLTVAAERAAQHLRDGDTQER